MAVSMKNVDVAFQGVGQKSGMDVWRIENIKPVPLSKTSFGKFYTGDSYIVLRTTALQSGAFHYDIHFWLGKDTSQDEAGTAAIKTVELDAALGGRAVQYRETQGHETEKFLSYFKPCIIPKEGGVASGFRKSPVREFEPRLFVVRGRRSVRVKQVPFARSSLNHDDVFVLDTESIIFQFNGATSSIQERGKALEVVQYIKDTDHDGTSEVIIIDDGTLGSEADTGQFWVLFGGFAPLAKKAVASDDVPAATTPKLFWVSQAKLQITFVRVIDQEPDVWFLSTRSITEGISKQMECAKEMLDSTKICLLDCGSELFIWTGRNTSLDTRKGAITVAEEYTSQNRPKHTQVTRIIEGFEPLEFRSHFNRWPLIGQTPVSEEGRGKVAALLKQQGVNVKGLLKGLPGKEEAPALLNANGKLEVWRIEGNAKKAVSAEDLGKFYDSSCYTVLYTYQGNKADRKDEYLLCYWLGQHTSPEEKAAGLLLFTESSSALKGRAVEARIVQGKEPPQFLALFKCMCILKESTSPSHKENTILLVRVRTAGPHIPQAVQVEPLAASLNSSDCFLLQTNSKLYAWSGNLSTAETQKVALRVAEFLKPGIVARPVKEGLEPPIFWSSLGGKRKYASQRDVKDTERDPRLFVCSLDQESLKVSEVFNFTQDDLLSEDVMILDCHNVIYVWVGQLSSSNNKDHALDIAQRYIERAAGLEGMSPDTLVFRVTEGNEPSFFTSYFTWDPNKVNVKGDSYTQKVAGLQGRPVPQGNSRRFQTPSASASAVDVSTQRATAMAALSTQLTSEGKLPNAAQSLLGQNTSSTPVSPRCVQAHVSVNSQRAAAMAALSSVLGTKPGATASNIDDDWVSVSSPITKVDGVGDSALVEPTSSKFEDGSDDAEEISEFCRYDHLKANSTDPAPNINLKRREAYLSPEEFEKLFGITKAQFYEMPKWKQDQRKRTLNLF